MSFLGGSSPQINFKPQGFNAPGGSLSFTPSGVSIFNQSPQQAANISGIQQTFGQQASDIAGLRPLVAPGFSAFRQAGLADLTTQQQSNISNLRDNLAQRRVLGSSFAGDAISRANAEFSAKRDQFIAQSYLQEVDASNKLIQEQYQAAAQSFKVGIDQFNFESGLSAQLTAQAMASSAAVATAQAKLDADAASGLGKALGSILTAPGSSVIGQGISGIGSALGSIGTSIGSALGGSAAAGEAGSAIAGALAIL